MDLQEGCSPGVSLAPKPEGQLHQGMGILCRGAPFGCLAPDHLIDYLTTGIIANQPDKARSATLLSPTHIANLLTNLHKHRIRFTVSHVDVFWHLEATQAQETRLEKPLSEAADLLEIWRMKELPGTVWPLAFQLAAPNFDI